MFIKLFIKNHTSIVPHPINLKGRGIMIKRWLVIGLICNMFMLAPTPMATAYGKLSLGCSISSPFPFRGEVGMTLMVDGAARSYQIYVPTDYDPRAPLPLLLSFHGLGGSPQDNIKITNWLAFAQKERFIAVFPKGSPAPLSGMLRWNIGPHLFLTEPYADDMAFIDGLLTEINTMLCVNQGQIFLSGFSLGGGMVNRLLCELGDRITAAAVVSGTILPLPKACQSQKRVPLITFYSLQDEFVPYQGGGAAQLPQVRPWISEKAKENACSMGIQRIPTDAKVVGIEYLRCKAAVVFYLLLEGPHQWPSSPIDATATIWEFFQKQAAP
jgi:polyhydroxybutyrate depolymerase